MGGQRHWLSFFLLCPPSSVSLYRANLNGVAKSISAARGRRRNTRPGPTTIAMSRIRPNYPWAHSIIGKRETRSGEPQKRHLRTLSCVCKVFRSLYRRGTTHEMANSRRFLWEPKMLQLNSVLYFGWKANWNIFFMLNQFFHLYSHSCRHTHVY